MQQAVIYSASTVGTRTFSVAVELSINKGIPGISIVGMPDASVKEARARIRSAISSCGYTMPRGHIIVNLAPSHIKKRGTAYDLPIALAILLASGQITLPDIESYIVVGELSLDGKIKPVQAMVSYELYCKEEDKTLLSGRNPLESLSIKGCDRRFLDSLQDVEHAFKALPYQIKKKHSKDKNFTDVYGQELAKRALCIAAAGSHNTLMVGCAGAGKTMLAERFASILPQLTEREAIESAQIHSLKGLYFQDILDGKRPFRAPHHSISQAALIGGAYPIMPGEISLAHNGVLFLDELSEYSSHTLQLLRQVLDLKEIKLSCSKEQITYPANFLLLAASNPCSCGNLYEGNCSCSQTQVTRYQDKLSGPLLDRIDIVFTIKKVSPSKFLYQTKPLSSEELSYKVKTAQAFARGRKEHQAMSSKLSERDKLFEQCCLGKKETLLLEHILKKSGVSARSCMKILSVARTIADMEECMNVCEDHLLEAFSYKVVEHG